MSRMQLALQQKREQSADQIVYPRFCRNRNRRGAALCGTESLSTPIVGISVAIASRSRQFCAQASCRLANCRFLIKPAACGALPRTRDTMATQLLPENPQSLGGDYEILPIDNVSNRSFFSIYA